MAKGKLPAQLRVLCATVKDQRAAGVRSRGRPLIMLALVLGGWTTMRVATWESPLPDMLDTIQSPVLAQPGPPAAELPRGAALRVLGAQEPRSKGVETREFHAERDLSRGEERRAASNVPAPAIAPIPQSEPLDLQTGASHQLLWLAAMAYMPVPKSVQDAFETSRAAPKSNVSRDQTAAQTPLLLPLQPQHNRWSLDAWVYWREGSASPLVALGRAPSYGASQAGALLRYQLDPAGPYRPNAYVRAYSSLEGRTEQELAVGVSVRPLEMLPLRVHTEARALQSDGRTRARMSGFVTTEIPPIALPLGARGEVYGQAGYVSGQQSTAFADGQLHIMRDVKDFDLANANAAKVSIGGAAFGGAQDGASRVDIGPTMRVETTIGATPARLSIDWRERVAGDAEPDSGLAVTLSTRF